MSELVESSERKSDGLRYAHLSIMGRKRAMEEAVAVGKLAGGEWCFFGVCKDHDGGGKVVAEDFGSRLRECLDKHIGIARRSPVETGFDWERVMMECVSVSSDEENRRVLGGCCGTMVVLMGKDDVVVVANCGEDSRAVLCRGDGALLLSRDHKADRAEEKKRIEAAGGRIVNWNGGHLKPYETSEPEVSVMTLKESDNFMIIATNGLWDVVCDEIACEVVKKCLGGGTRKFSSECSGASEAAATLAELAIAKGSKDNISVIVVVMK